MPAWVALLVIYPNLYLGIFPIVNCCEFGHFPNMTADERPFHEIVQSRLDELGENPFSMAAKSGVSYDKFRNVLRNDARRADPKVETAREICNALGLEFYIGAPRDTAPVHRVDLDGTDFAPIPVHRVELAAGCGAENHTEDLVGHLAFRRSWLQRIGVSASSAVLARAAGDSMAPTIHDGDMLLIDRSRAEAPRGPRGPKDTRPAPIFAILDDGLARVKRIELVPGGTLALLSDNPVFGPEFRQIGSVSIIGRVMWWGHTNRE
ncbi:helix-turn-helix transcriptional regulator [Luteovulum azotoformans]|nr:helix-turn-helix transcriptional regulator [Cereibacter azotoformans]